MAADVANKLEVFYSITLAKIAAAARNACLTFYTGLTVFSQYSDKPANLISIKVEATTAQMSVCMSIR